MSLPVDTYTLAAQHMLSWLHLPGDLLLMLRGDKQAIIRAMFYLTLADATVTNVACSIVFLY
jgi:hypothetical protein